MHAALQFESANASLPTLAWLEAPLPSARLMSAARYVEFVPLGRGGKAEVFRCRDQWLGRHVAYKVVLHGLAEDNAEIVAFLREARILAGLAHAGVPTVFDLGRDAHGRPFFTQTYIPGPSLRQVVARLTAGDENAQHEWPLVRLLRVVLTAAEAVAHAHGRGALHCDLKPDNVLVGPGDGGQVVDWGIACVLGESQQRDAPCDASTPRQLRRGSPLYMAPEQAANGALDERTDVFGLGAVLYECLTLSPPARGRAAGDVLRNIQIESPPPPRQLAPWRGVAAELDALVMRALARLPGDRFTTAAEFQRALRECYLDLLGAQEREPAVTPLLTTPMTHDIPDWWDLQATDAWVGSR